MADPTPTADYDVVHTFAVNPDGIKAHGETLKNLGDEVAQSIFSIITSVNGLHNVSWQGNTADEANAFIHRWAMAVTELFGSKGHPEQGVLNAIVGGVLTAGANFGAVDESYREYFDNFRNALQQSQTAGGDPWSTTPPQTSNDPHATAVFEQF